MPGIENPTVVTLTLVLVIILFAGLVHGTLGIGFPLVSTPILALVMDVRLAVLDE